MKTFGMSSMMHGRRPVLLYFQSLESSNPTKAGMGTGLTPDAFPRSKATSHCEDGGYRTYSRKP